MAKSRESYTEHDNDGGELGHEVIAQEHIPYQIVLLNAIEDVRKGIAHNEDGGLSTLLSLWAVLPAHIRREFADLPGEVAFQGRVEFYFRNRYKKRAIRQGAVSHRVFDPYTAQFNEVVDHPAQTVKVRVVASRRVEVEDLRPVIFKRQFVLEKLTEIIDKLDSQGLLWKSRLELVGNENDDGAGHQN